MTDGMEKLWKITKNLPGQLKPGKDLNQVPPQVHVHYAKHDSFYNRCHYH
jgi:hypothetical protein